MGLRRKLIPVSLFRVIRLDADSHQTLANSLVLIVILWSQRLCQRVPELLENHYQLLGRNALLMRFLSDFPEKRRQFRRRSIGLFQLFG